MWQPVIEILEFEPGQVPESREIPGAEANFTWADLNRLRGRLVIAPDSLWVPPIIGDNLIRTIKYVLNPQNAREGMPLCGGVNIQDLYHGHIVIPMSQKIPDDLKNKRKDFQAKYDPALEKAFPGFIGSDKPSAAERQAIRQVDASTLKEFQSLLALTVKTFPRASILYHTYEHVQPQGMAANDPRRHILMPFSGTTPTIGAYLNVIDGGKYSSVIEITFLVSPKGEVFVRGSIDTSIKGLEF